MDQDLKTTHPDQNQQAEHQDALYTLQECVSLLEEYVRALQEKDALISQFQSSGSGDPTSTAAPQPTPPVQQTNEGGQEEDEEEEEEDPRCLRKEIETLQDAVTKKDQTIRELSSHNAELKESIQRLKEEKFRQKEMLSEVLHLMRVNRNTHTH
ncbi:hypothetical protein AALO_G00088880 [Alosa alosa]|uniref:Uncharacterized protein n=1 Tax=Alosa alosa TaxID=278164 RepID=A0AAV6H3U3_9TELE|nr:hypothetical protein AALO_G00088880 [Alosa alosa]